MKMGNFEEALDFLKQTLEVEISGAYSNNQMA
jgi:hypothetical protein